jgi:hypothetical protein
MAGMSLPVHSNRSRCFADVALAPTKAPCEALNSIARHATPTMSAATRKCKCSEAVGHRAQSELAGSRSSCYL